MVQPTYCCDCELSAKPRDGRDQLGCRLVVLSRDFVHNTMALKHCKDINTRGQCKDYKVKEEVKD